MFPVNGTVESRVCKLPPVPLSIGKRAIHICITLPAQPEAQLCSGITRDHHAFMPWHCQQLP